MRYRLGIVLLFGSLFFLACTEKNTPTHVLSSLDKEKKLDSIYENFEDIAYNDHAQYLSNPDSFLTTLKVAPQSAYQQEMYAYGLIFIAYTLMENGSLYESIKYYEKAYNVVQQHTILLDDFSGSIIKPLSNLYTRINDTEKAIHLLEKTILSTQNVDEKAALNNNLANAYLYNNQIEKATLILEENIEKTTNTKFKALLYNSLASIYYEKKEYSNSIKYNKLARTFFEKDSLRGDTLLWYIGALGLHTQLQQDLSSTQKALRIININFPNTQHRLKAKLIAIEGNILQAANDPNVIDHYNRIIKLFAAQKEEQLLDYTYTEALLGKARYFTTTGALDSALYYYERAIENDFSTQQLITSPKDQIRNNRYNRETIEALITLVSSNEALHKQPSVLQQVLWCIELSKARLLINEINRSDQWNNANKETKNAVYKIQDLYRQKDQSKEHSKKKAFQKQIDALVLEFQLAEQYFEMVRYVPNKATFLKNLTLQNTDFYTYHIHKDKRITLIHLANKGIKMVSITDTSFLGSVGSFKADYFGSSPDSYNSNPSLFKRRAHIILQHLLPTLQQQNVFISLDGSLYGLPFDALYDSSFLVNKHNFAYLNSFLLFDILKQKSKKDYPVSLLFRSEYNAPLPTLTFVKKEIDNISAFLQTEKIDMHQQTDEVLKKQFAKSNIIHIAAHTILDSTEAPVIFLKDPLSTDQIRYLEIKSPLVFLSACNTGTGESLPSEGTESIQRVFLSKNVPSVISTYWFANDETMLLITSNFYRLLAQLENPITALAESKRKYLQAANSQAQNPWYWANINYAGVGNNIGLKKSSNLYLYFTLGVILSLCYFQRSWLYHSFKKIFKKTNDNR